MFVVLYVGIKAIDRWADNAERRAHLCKEKEFKKQMRRVDKESHG